MKELTTFALDTPDPSGTIEGARALAVHANDFGRLFNKAGPRAALKTPLVFDTGASSGLSPFRSDFLNNYEAVKISVKGVAGRGSIIGGGTILRKFTTRCGAKLFIPSHGYHFPEADIRLESPQSLIRAMGGSGHAVVNGWNIEWHLPDRRIIDIPIDPVTNLPLFTDFVCTSDEKKKFESESMESINQVCMPCEEKKNDHFDQYERKKALHHCTSVVDETNQNLSGTQRELLHWHHKLCLNMQDLQQLMKPQNVRDQEGTIITKCPPVIPTKFKSTANLKRDQYPLCLSCKLATAKARSSDVITQKPVASKEGALSRDQYEPGDNIATDQFVVKTPGRLIKGYGREAIHNCFHGGTIFQDSASNLVRVQPQVSLSAGETVVGKSSFEDWIWNLAGVLAKNYHSDNGIFIAELFRSDCQQKKQSQTFSGVGAKHQNGKAERAIQTISYWARTMMTHVALHWPDDNADNIRLWAFAVTHAAWLYNHMPNRNLGWMSPLEIFTKTRSDHHDLLRTRVWGCPAFVLHPKLQDGQKIPKFNRRGRMGQFLGFSDQHSSLVAMVRNLGTNFVSPQFHVVFDEKFTTIQNDTRLGDSAVESVFNDLFVTCRDFYGEEGRPPEDEKSAPEGVEAVDPPPELGGEWLTEAERRDKDSRGESWRSQQHQKRSQQAKEFEQLNDDFNPIWPLDNFDVPSAASISDDDDSSTGDSVDSFTACCDAPEGAPDTVAPSLPPTPRPPRRSRRLRGEAEGPRRSRRLRGEAPEFMRVASHPDYARCCTSMVSDKMKNKGFIQANRAQFACTLGTKQPPRSARLSRKKKEYKTRLASTKLREVNEKLGAMDWEVPDANSLMTDSLTKFVHFAAADCGFDGSIEALVVNWLHPLMLAAKTASTSGDNTNWKQAMNGLFADEYWEAACTEVETLERMKAWEVVEREVTMNVLSSTWAFKCKRYPDGLIKKFKARFCARGDQQIEGVDYFETYAPVVMWTTIRLMLILECLLDLKSKQGDVNCAFLHAHLPEEESVYVHMPQGFTQYDKKGKAKVLKLNRCLYGLKNSPRAFWKYMVEKLEFCGLQQSKLDPCLFIGDTVIAVMYVDDLLMWSTEDNHMIELGQLLNKAGVDIEEENDAAGFLGVKLTKTPEGSMMMTQEGLIGRIIEAMGLDVEHSTPKSTPCLKAPLTKDVDGDPCSESFAYASIVGMLLYLSGHSRPDISYSVSQVARFTFCPRRSHEAALKMIGRYLLGTINKGLIINPTRELKIDAYPDADFAGLYNYEEHNDPICVRSRTGYVINVAGCPVLWKSQLQTETATSTMQSEVISLAACCRELIPIVNMVKEIGSAVGLTTAESTKMHVCIHEDNAGALVLDKTLPPQFTPAGKHYAVKTHWFREKCIEMGIEIVKICTTEQLGDICTKCLPAPTFQYLRKKLMGW